MPGKYSTRRAAPMAALHDIASPAETAHRRPLASSGTDPMRATPEDRADFHKSRCPLSCQLHLIGRLEPFFGRGIAIELFQELRQQGPVRLNNPVGVAPFDSSTEELRGSFQHEATNPTADSRLQSIDPTRTVTGFRESNAHERTNSTTNPHPQPIRMAVPQVRRRPLGAVVETKPNCAPSQAEASQHQTQFSKRSQSRPMETEPLEPRRPATGLHKSNAHDQTNPTTDPHLQPIRTADPQVRTRSLAAFHETKPSCSAALQTNPIATHSTQPPGTQHPRPNKPNQPTPPRPPP